MIHKGEVRVITRDISFRLREGMVFTVFHVEENDIGCEFQEHINGHSLRSYLSEGTCKDGHGLWIGSLAILRNTMPLYQNPSWEL